MWDLWNLKTKIIVTVSLVVVVIIGYLIYMKWFHTDNSSQTNEIEYIYVHIVGEVNKEGTYILKKGTRLFELIELAGGATEEANLSILNLSKKLDDEEKIVVPSINQNNNNNHNGGMACININTASKEELMTLSGIGDKKSTSIIQYREYKPFESVFDIMNVSGISVNIFNDIKPFICV